MSLLPDPARSTNGYRTYEASTITRARFIRTAQAVGLTLAEIGNVIDLRDEGQAPCSHVVARLDPAGCTDADICQILAAPT